MATVKESVIEISDLRKVYRVGEEKVIALDTVSLSIARGEVCAILGTSGSGKSTLLNLMAGLEKPSRGSVTITNYPIHKMDEIQLARFRQLKMGFIFQSYHLLPAYTALENVMLPLIFRGMPRREREVKAKKMLADVGLKKHIHHKPSQLSGGQQQRVGIARAFVSKPPVIFADEPTGNLDSRTTEEIIQLMLAMTNEHKQTLVLVTHDHQVAACADRVIHILDGKIERIEVPGENACYFSSNSE
ncbi:MAG: ABC transporter ATP-binding protein [Methanobacterium sp.]